MKREYETNENGRNKRKKFGLFRLFRPFSFVSYSLFIFLPLLNPPIGYAQQASETGSFRNDQSVYIVTWKRRGYYDRDLMAQLHRNLSQRVRIEAGGRFDSNRRTLDRYQERTILDRATPYILPGEWTDHELKMRIEEQFTKQKKFRLAESLDKADYVFLVQGEYVFHYDNRNSGGGNGLTSMREGHGPNALARVRAVAIPVLIYQQRPGRVTKILDTAPWRGEEIGAMNYDGTFDEASTEKLMKRFHKEALKK
jgi:hypothetical protein